MKKIFKYLLLAALIVCAFFLVRNKLGAFFYNQGNVYFERSLYEKARVSYGNSIRTNSDVWMAHLGLAETYRETKDYDQALREYQETLKLNPLCLRAYQSLSHIYVKRGMYEDALAILNKARERKLDNRQINEFFNPACYAYMVDSLDKSTRLFLAEQGPEAISILEETLKACPGMPVVYYTLGFYYMSGRDYSRAIEKLKEAVRIAPDFSAGYQLLAYISFEKNDFELAVFYGEKALAYNKKDPAIYNDLGIALMNLERYAQAALYLKEAVELEPANQEYIYSLASVYRDNKMFEQALTEYTKLESLKADYPSLHNDLGDIYHYLGKENDALQHYRKEIEYCQERLKGNPLEPVTLNNYAHALNWLGESARAKEIIEKVIFAYPDYRQACITLSQIYDKTNKPLLATEFLEKAKKLSASGSFINLEISKLSKREIDSPENKVRPDRGELIHLKNGRRLRGRIKSEDPDKLVFEINMEGARGNLIIGRDTIERIEKI